MDEYTKRLEKIEAELKQWLPQNNEKVIGRIFGNDKKEINAESLGALFDPLHDILVRGGKRWRPLLMTLICETIGGGDSSLPLAPLVEFSHNASLIHDDIEDDSDQRRGKPAIHQIYGLDTAINSGSFFYFMSSCCIEAFSGENKEEIYRAWGEHMRRLHMGQAMDIRWHNNIKFTPEIDEYYFMCGLKTGSLARLAAELGVYTAGISDKVKTAEASRLLSDASEKLGIGFQILDDVKNLTTGIPGKKSKDDIVEGKKSLPVTLYLHKHPEKRDKIFYCIYEAKTNGASVPEADEMLELLRESGVMEEAEEKARALLQEARVVFGRDDYAGVPAGKEGRSLLDGLIVNIS
ncbi:MAG: polyprenyl synthetase family protein [Treponema sp.]|nr:polyprenyl synthetase family protein [Treponema sp.]MCL2272996.1 polyprenyl synthetase family protein [Treponema sp.]